jgi:hypothetical protein
MAYLPAKSPAIRDAEALPSSAARSRPARPSAFPLCAFILIMLLLSCGSGTEGTKEEPPTRPPLEITQEALLTRLPSLETATPSVPLVDLVLESQDVAVVPQPLRAGFPFSITTVIHNYSQIPAVDVPLLFHVSAIQDELGYSPYLQVLTVTVPASSSLPVEVPVDWNFAGGEHQIWVQVNQLPESWQSPTSLQPEADGSDNLALLELMMDPFDAYTSDLCPGRVDVEVTPVDVLPEPDQQRVLVRIHNTGNRALYNLPVVVLGDDLSGIAYSPAIPPCGGTVEVVVGVDNPFQQGTSLTVQVNPEDWDDTVPEDDYSNNQVSVAAGLAPGLVVPPDSGLDDYDFSITDADIETPEAWIVLVTVHNLGTRDAAMVPIRVENEAGRQITDAIPLVQGDGLGVAAIRVGYLWTPGGRLTFTVNPEDAKDAYPEASRDNNVATFTLP